MNKLKEIKNGRLAMIAFTGFVAQHAATGKVGQPMSATPETCPMEQPLCRAAITSSQDRVSDVHMMWQLPPSLLTPLSYSYGKRVPLRAFL